MQTLLVFSGNKPQAVLNIERELWSALIDVAKGTAETGPRTRQAFRCIDEIIRGEDLATLSGWFGGVSLVSHPLSHLTST